MKIKTSELQELVSRASVGSVSNKLLPITSLMEIELVGGELKLATTDGSTYLYVKQSGVDGEDFKVVVETSRFSKLVKKITSDYIYIDLQEKYLNVKGNGEYKIELLFDNGGEINYPNPLGALELVNPRTIKLADINSVYDALKSSRAMTTKVMSLTGYCFGKRAVTTDGYIMSGVDINMFNNQCLLSESVLNLVCRAPGDKMQVYFVENSVVFESPTYVVYGELMDDSDYPTENTIDTLLSATASNKCDVSKTRLLNALDRLELFVSMDDRGIVLNFNEDSLMITTALGSGAEYIPYRDGVKDVVQQNVVNIDFLITQLKSMPDDLVTIEYGDNRKIRLVAGNVTKILALMAN